MSVAFLLQRDDLGQDKYDAVMREIGLDRIGARWPEGVLGHTAGKTAGGGWCVVDIWESEAAFARFRDLRLGPPFAKVGGIPEPKVTTFQVYSRYSAG
jgi:hypothetical protein